MSKRKQKPISFEVEYKGQMIDPISAYCYRSAARREAERVAAEKEKNESSK